MVTVKKLSFLTLLLFCIINTNSYAEQPVKSCSSIYKNKKLTREEIVKLNLNNKNANLNLCGANLENINLSNLRYWQKDYITNKKRFNVLVVHRRAWKTVWAVLDELIESMDEVWDYWYIAPTYRQAKKIAWRMIQKFWDQIKWFTYNASELIVNYTNWSTISLSYAFTNWKSMLTPLNITT